MFRLLLLVLIAGAGLAFAHERSVSDLKAVCGAFDSMETSAAGQILNQIAGDVSPPQLEVIRERCAKTQFHIGMFFGEDGA